MHYMDYKTSDIPPPVYESAKELWGVDFDKGTVFTYGSTIHSKTPLSDDLLAHELVHVRQQTLIGRDEWWMKYFADPEFRLEQETEAYRAQYKWFVNNLSAREGVAKTLVWLASLLSGEMYGKLITRSEAIKLISK